MNANERKINRALEREAEAARDLVDFLNSENADLNHDMIEGETQFLEAIDMAVQAIDEAEMIIAGCKDREAVFKDRRGAAERRVSRIRSMIEQAICRADIGTVSTAGATLTVKATLPAPLYESEADIPAKFWKQGDPTLDRAAIKKAIADGETIPGVSLTNGGVSLQIRRS